MFNNLFGMQVSVSDLSILATITTVLVQFLKQIVPKKFPTQILTLIVGIVITIIYVGITQDITAARIICAVLMGSITAFISMNGFDALRDIWKRVSGESGDT